MHEDGYCDRCGAEVIEPQLTVDGLELCAGCATAESAKTTTDAQPRGAYDDGR